MEKLMNKQAKVSEFTTTKKKQNLHSFNNILLGYIIYKINIIPIQYWR